jgi:hypothetical protein
MTLTIRNASDLYCRYPSQSERQPCYVELDARDNGRLAAEHNPEIGNAVPFAVWHGHITRWAVPVLRADSANALLAAIAPLAARVVAGYSATWYGSNSVALYDEDATEAIEEIARLCGQAGGEGEEMVVYEASSWFDGLGSRTTQAKELGISAATTDEELREIGRRALDDARAEDVDEVEDVDEYLAELRNELLAEA